MEKELTERVYAITGPPVVLRVLDAVRTIPSHRLTGMGVAKDGRNGQWFLFLVYTDFLEDEVARLSGAFHGEALPVTLTLAELFAFPLSVLVTGPEPAIRAGLEIAGA